MTRAIGVASPRAQGHAMTRVEIMTINASSYPEFIGLSIIPLPIVAQNKPDRRASIMTTGTKIAEILSTNLWIGALPDCASSTIEIMLASKVSSATLLVLSNTVPSSTIVPA